MCHGAPGAPTAPASGGQDTFAPAGVEAWRAGVPSLSGPGSPVGGMREAVTGMRGRKAGGGSPGLSMVGSEPPVLW